MQDAFRAGYAFLHSAIDDCSRLVYSEIHGDEKKETAARFWARATAFYTAHGITVSSVMTDIGSCHKSKLFNAALATATHKYTRPYRPLTRGGIERFHRTLAIEWTHARHYGPEQTRMAPIRSGCIATIITDPYIGLGGLLPPLLCS